MTPNEAKEDGGVRDQVREQDREKLREKVRPMLAALFPNATSPMKQILPGMAILDLDDAGATKEAFEGLSAYQREGLVRRLRIAVDLARKAKSLSEAVQRAEDEHTRYQQALDKNLAAVYKQIRPVETQYRTLNQFFDNAARSPGERINAWIYNTDPASLFEDASESLERLTLSIQNTNAEALNQTKAKSMMVIPGHWAESAYLNKIEEMLADNRVVLFTDIFAGMKGMEDFNNMLARLELPKYQGLKQGSVGRAHIAVCTNELCGREKYAWEDDHVWLPASSTIAGKLYNVDQTWDVNAVRDGAAGFRNGKIKASSPMVRTKLNNSQMGGLNQTFNIIPLVENQGNVYIMGVRTLCTNEDFKQYPTVRIHDFLTKIMLDYSRLLLFERFDDRSVEKVRSAMKKFYDYMVNQGVIRAYANIRVTRDGKPGERGKAKVDVDVSFFDTIEQVRVGVGLDENGQVEKA